jgi:hypothetical protein
VSKTTQAPNVGPGDPTRVSAGPLGTTMAQADGDKRKFPRTRGGDASEERFRAAFKQITDIVAKLGLQQDVRDQAQVTPGPLTCCARACGHS